MNMRLKPGRAGAGRGNGGWKRSELSALYEQDDAFGQGIVACRVVFLLEAGAEQGGKRLVEAGTEGAEEGFHQVVAGRAGLSVHQLYQQLALCEGEFLHAGHVLFLQALFDPLQVFLPFLRRKGLEVFVGFDDDLVHLLGDGQYLLDVAHQAVVLRTRPFVLELERLEDVDGGKLHIRDGISFVNAHGSEIHLAGLFTDLLLGISGGNAGYQQEDGYYEELSVHERKSTSFFEIYFEYFCFFLVPLTYLR